MKVGQNVSPKHSAKDIYIWIFKKTLDAEFWFVSFPENNLLWPSI